MTDERPASEHEEQVNRVLADYMEKQRLGQAPNREDLLRQHSGLADELRSFFADQDRFGQLADCINSPAAPSPACAQEPTGPPGQTAGGNAVPGTVPCIAGYELLEEIARGGMGVVYKARQVRLNRTVALKMILAGQFASPADVQRFHREAEAAAKLDHPNVVPIYEVGEHQGQPYFSMKFLEGGSLARRKAPLPARQAAVVVVTVARAVHHAHQRGILHRDLKPGNILLDAQGEPHVSDFGLARQVEGDLRHTQPGAIVGTPNYMPPEQARADKDLTTGVDVYSLGAILYELLTGRPPFRGGLSLDTILQVLERDPEPPRKIDRAIDRDLETICLKCLEKDPQRRYDSAAALADDLQNYLAGEPIRARPVSRAERLVRWARRHPAVGAAACLAVLALFATTVGAFAYAEDQARVARRFEQLNNSLEAEGERTRAALKERNQQLAIVALERAQGQHTAGETGRGLLHLVEAIRFAREAGDEGLERNARTLIGTWQGEAHRLRSVVASAEPSMKRPIGLVAFGPGGRTALVGIYQTARLIDPTTGRPLGPVLNYPGLALGFALSADGTTVAVASHVPGEKKGAGAVFSFSQVQLFDVASGKPLAGPIRHPPAAPSVIQALTFSPDGKTLVTGSTDRTARRWDVPSGKEVGSPLEHPGPITAVAFSPDGRMIAVRSTRRTQFWEAASGKAIGSGLEHPRGVLGLAFSPDSKALLTAEADGVARLWDVSSSKEIGRFQTSDGALKCVAFSPTGRHVLTGAQSGAVRLWDVARASQVGPPLANPRDLLAVAFRRDGQGALTATLDGTIQAWDLAGVGGMVSTGLKWKTGAKVNALAFHPDGRSLLTAGDDKTARLWDARSGAPLGPPLIHTSRVVSAAFSPDGKVALTACWRMQRQGKRFQPTGEVFRWSVTTGAALGRLIEVPKIVRSATFVRGGQAVLLISCKSLTAGLELQLFDAVSGKPISASLRPGGTRADHVALSPDGKTVLTGSHLGKYARLWDFETGQPLGPPLEHPDWVRAVAFSPDGRTFATGCKDKVVRLWSTATGAPVGEAMGHHLPVIAVAFSPDGKALLTGCADDVYTNGEARLWDATSGQPIAPVRPSSQAVTALAFRPDGQAVATACGTLSLRGGGEGEVATWHLPAPVSGDVDWLRSRFQLWTGLELRETGSYRLLTPQAWRQRKQELEGEE